MAAMSGSGIAQASPPSLMMCTYGQAWVYEHKYFSVLSFVI
jgi:hypothetical protein